MTPGARVAAAIAVLDDILGGTAAEKALTGWARRARYAGSGDRAAVRDHVFQALRCRRSYAAIGGGQSGRALMCGAWRAAGADPAEVFTGIGHAPPPLSDREITAGRSPEPGPEMCDLPDWLWPRFKASLGPQAESAARLSQSRAPVMLRVNSQMNSAPEVIDILKESNILARQSSIADTALIVVEGQRRIAGSRAFREGRAELQDGSSQAAMAALPIPAGARVLDYCAGGGGKVLALAARHQATWLAHDIDPGRMRDLPDRAARAKANIICLTGAEVLDQAPYDVVLCDVPCSGSGTWRRSPEAKWTLTPERLIELQQMQAQILRDVAPLVGPRGMLAYTTCSILTEENEAQVAGFLQDVPGWRLDHEKRWNIGSEGDGFYYAQMKQV